MRSGDDSLGGTGRHEGVMLRCWCTAGAAVITAKGIMTPSKEILDESGNLVIAGAVEYSVFAP